MTMFYLANWIAYAPPQHVVSVLLYMIVLFGSALLANQLFSLCSFRKHSA